MCAMPASSRLIAGVGQMHVDHDPARFTDGRGVGPPSAFGGQVEAEAAPGDLAGGDGAANVEGLEEPS